MCKLQRMTDSLTRLLLSALAGSIAACSAPGAVRPSDDPSFLSPQMHRAVLIVSRVGSVMDDGCSYHVAIDSTEAGMLAAKGWVTMYPPTGTYTVSVRADGIGCPAPVQVRIRLEANQQQRLRVARGANGSLAWSAEDSP